jgi:hypothetical protein
MMKFTEAVFVIRASTFVILSFLALIFRLTITPDPAKVRVSMRTNKMNYTPMRPVAIKTAWRNGVVARQEEFV